MSGRSIPTTPEVFANEDTAVLFNDLVAIRKTLLLFAAGNFDFDLVGRNVFMAALKTLQANLRHLIWQVGQVEQGDFTQRVDFMGTFSEAFNSMTAQLDKALTELKEREASLLAMTADLKSSEERWNLAVQCSRDGIWDINMNSRTAWYSDNFMQMMHYTDRDLPQDLRWETKIHSDDRFEADAFLTMLQGTGDLRPFSVDCRFQRGHKPDDYIWLRLRGMPASTGNVHRLVVIASDITSLKESEQTLIHQAMYDNLTGLPNRYLLEDRLKQAVANSVRTGNSFIFVTLDLDFFKQVNDTYGHATGDHILITLAQRLSMGLRSTDTVARLGGDEFVAIYPCDEGTEQTTAERVMRRFYENLKSPVMLGDVAYQLRSSVGIAFFPKHAQNLPSLFERADKALYKAKENGKNQYAIYE